jgi:selenocysteine-specific translation elongation factor
VFNVEREERVTTARKQIVKIAYEAKEWSTVSMSTILHLFKGNKNHKCRLTIMTSYLARKR